MEMCAGGLSKRDIDEVSRDGKARLFLPCATVPEGPERLRQEYEPVVARDLPEHQIIFLFGDRTAERLRPEQPPGDAAGKRPQRSLALISLLGLCSIWPGSLEVSVDVDQYMRSSARHGRPVND